MLDRFLLYIQQEKLINNGEKILLSVSGGMDSMMMCHLFLKTDFNIGIAHINHHLRSEESDNDAKFVIEFAKKNNLTYYQYDIDPSELKTGNTQDKARQLRYKWLLEVAEKYHYDKIATAHHKDDSIETFFINLIRGSGLSGLDGIDIKNGKIIRPMLFTTKAQIDEFCTLSNILYREDSSNKSDKYLRNRLRNKILPLLLNADNRAYEGILTTIEHLKETNQLLEFLIQKSASPIIETFSDYEIVSLDEFKNEVIYKQWLYHLLLDYNFNVEQIAEIIKNKITSGNRYLTSTHEAITDRNKLIIRKTGSNFYFNQEIKINCLPFEFQWSNVSIRIYEKKFSSTIPKDTPEVFYINADKLSDDIILRGFRQGDKFKPIGMHGKSQKLKDFFINNKINLFEKERILVLVHKDEIIAIPGHRKSELVSINSETKKIWSIEYTWNQT